MRVYCICCLFIRYIIISCACIQAKKGTVELAGFLLGSGADIRIVDDAGKPSTITTSYN